MRPLALYAYPSGPRRDEVLDTLLMAAAGGQGRRRVRETANLLRNGMRARLGRPRSRAVGVFATIVALVAGFFAAALANRLAWEAAPDMPSASERAALAEMIAPGLPMTWAEWSPDDPADQRAPFATTGGGELDARQIDSTTPGTAQTAQVATYLAGLRKRLSDAGWRVVRDYPSASRNLDGTPQDDSAAILARNDRLVLMLWNNHDPANKVNELDATVYRAEPTWISAVTFAAGLPGAILGWLVFGWASRRTEGRPAATALTISAAALGLVLVLPAVLLAADYLTVLTGDYLPGSPFWIGLEPTNEFGGLALPAEAMFAVALLIAAFCRPVQRRQPQLADQA